MWKKTIVAVRCWTTRNAYSPSLDNCLIWQEILAFYSSFILTWNPDKKKEDMDMSSSSQRFTTFSISENYHNSWWFNTWKENSSTAPCAVLEGKEMLVWTPSLWERNWTHLWFGEQKEPTRSAPCPAHHRNLHPERKLGLKSQIHAPVFYRYKR